ncbi:hypothetical protein EW093_02075 [Thiospirochaeta perfilievii]|uniref:Fibronectin type-III domain-containing protein n=1 Tax=Thiospirochaeta perfilievii TaxID=252967 RepID=A0A5C1Q6D3_9SPIO|nr:hypothetical protein [Thiospirochaeta perfilievii]QEN03535.1 hypothetical protein EW093_02075 [Thiospirochaeta perfilievii]
MVNMRKILNNLLIILIPTLLLSCEMIDRQNSSNNNVLNIKIVIEGSSSSNSKAKVFLEGSDGNLVTGSNVIILNDTGVASLLTFNFEEGSYYGEIPVSASGAYEIRVKSALIEETLISDVQYHGLSKKAEINMLQDDNSLSALEGNTLSSEDKIHMGWSEVLGASIYQVKVYRDGNLIYTKSSSDLTCIIDGGTLQEGSDYYCKVDAQYISGDPLFVSSFYYSFSESLGSSLYFNLD